MLDVARDRRESLNGFNSNQSEVSEDGTSPAWIEKAATKPQEAEPQLLHKALLIAIRALPDMEEQVNLHCLQLRSGAIQDTGG